MKVSVPVVLGAALLMGVGSASALRGQAPTTFIVESPTMTTGRFMPRDYSPDGRNLSPPLSWRGLPIGTRQLAVISQDYGAGRPPPWVHWIIYNIPGDAQGLPEGIPFDPDHPMPAEITGRSRGTMGGACPPTVALHLPPVACTITTSPSSPSMRSSTCRRASIEANCCWRSRGT